MSDIIAFQMRAAISLTVEQTQVCSKSNIKPAEDLTARQLTQRQSETSQAASQPTVKSAEKNPDPKN